MSHPDENTIQMLLDDELDPIERARIESHAAECAACQARIAEGRAFQLEADRLVGVLEVPSRAASAPATQHRRPILRALAWAASIVAAVGLGYFGRGSTAPRPIIVAEVDTTAQPTPAAASKTTAAPQIVVPATPAAAPADERHSPVAAPPSAGMATTQEDRASRDAAAAEPAAANATQAKVASAETERARNDQVGGWRVIALEEAVRILDGQVRLIDGLTPERVETGPGTAVAGADPTAAVVRLVYASGTIVLDEQRVGTAASGGRLEAARPLQRAVAPPAGWREAGGIRFAVTGSVSPDSLGLLAARVR
jgi:anti-sigma factor RsiW